MNPNLKKNAQTILSCASNFFLVACIILLLLGNYSSLRANNFLEISIQVPTSKSTTPTSSKSVKPVTKNVVKTSVTKKKKMRKVVAVVKDSVEVEIDPANSNPPLFQKQ